MEKLFSEFFLFLDSFFQLKIRNTLTLNNSLSFRNEPLIYVHVNSICYDKNIRPVEHHKPTMDKPFFKKFVSKLINNILCVFLFSYQF